MSEKSIRAVIEPNVILDHTEAVTSSLQRYHNALASMWAAEHTVRAVVDNALLAGVSIHTVRDIIDGFADAQDVPLLRASDVDPRLTEDKSAAMFLPMEHWGEGLSCPPRQRDEYSA